VVFSLSYSGISDAYYCAECTRLEKDRDGCPKIVNLGASRTDLFYERRRLGEFVPYAHDFSFVRISDETVFFRFQEGLAYAITFPLGSRHYVVHAIQIPKQIRWIQIDYSSGNQRESLNEVLVMSSCHVMGGRWVPLRQVDSRESFPNQRNFC